MDSLLIVTGIGLDAVWNGTLSQISAITYISPTYNYIGPCLQFFGRNRNQDDLQ